MQSDKNDINDIQALIIRQLFTHESLRFSEINIKDIPSDQLSYHLRQLIKYGVIEKNDNNQYRLSVKGRGLAVLMDTPSNKFMEQGFIACRIILSREHDGQTEYLMQKRRKVPYRGHFSEPGGKIAFGEDVITAATRNMINETGLTCDMTVCGMAHFRDSYQEQIVQDKFFFAIKATNPRGELLVDGPTGANNWMTLADIASNPKTHQGVIEMIRMVDDRSRWFVEEVHFTEEY